MSREGGEGGIVSMKRLARPPFDGPSSWCHFK
jgi:hypothetical protein